MEITDRKSYNPISFLKYLSTKDRVNYIYYLVKEDLFKILFSKKIKVHQEFTWLNTFEGHDYWELLHEDYFKNMNYEYYYKSR